MAVSLAGFLANLGKVERIVHQGTIQDLRKECETKVLRKMESSQLTCITGLKTDKLQVYDTPNSLAF